MAWTRARTYATPFPRSLVQARTRFLVQRMQALRPDVARRRHPYADIFRKQPADPTSLRRMAETYEHIGFEEAVGLFLRMRSRNSRVNLLTWSSVASAGGSRLSRDRPDMFGATERKAKCPPGKT